MQCLVISAIPPPVSELDAHGIYQRLALFMGAIGRFAGMVHTLHFCPSSFIERHADIVGLQRVVSQQWGLDVTVGLSPTRQLPETIWNHYAQGVISASAQPIFSKFSGPEQIAAVTSVLDTAPDLVFVHRLTAMNSVLRSRRRPQRMFFDLDDVEHKVRARSALQPPRWPGKLVYLAHVPALLRAERQACARSQATFVCSETDRGHLENVGIRQRVHVVPNAISTPAAATRTSAETVPRECVLFIGDYQYEPNVRAANRLVMRIWPRVRQTCPDATLVVAGRTPENVAGFSAPPPGVSYPGFVLSLDQLYARTGLVCCPLMMGGGTRLKLLEAAAYAKPIVSTRIGAEGLALRDGQEVLLRDDDASFAEACVMLLQDHALSQRLGQAARAMVESLYHRPTITERIEQIMRSAEPPV